MNKLIIEPHYFGSLEFYCLLNQYDKVIFDISKHFIKQTYRNRTKILGVSGGYSLAVPVHHKNHTPYKEVKIDYSQTWLREHIGGIKAAYGKTPFFGYFFDLFFYVFNQKPTFLVDLNIKLFEVANKCMQNTSDFSIQENYKPDYPDTHFDARDVICSKIQHANRNIYTVSSYSQQFVGKFVPNLGILDVLMNEGTETKYLIQKSTVQSHKNI